MNPIALLKGKSADVAQGYGVKEYGEPVFYYHKHIIKEKCRILNWFLNKYIIMQFFLMQFCKTKKQHKTSSTLDFQLPDKECYS